MKFRSLIIGLSLVAVYFSVSAQVQQAWVAKYDNGISNGNHQALKMALDSIGNIYVLGVSANTNTNTGYALVKYAPNGNQLWAARYDSTNFPTASPTDFSLDSSNNVVVTGSAVSMKFNVYGNLLWMEPYSGTGITTDPGQNIYVTGVAGNFTTSKLNPSGSNLWSQTWIYQGLPNLSQVIALDSSTNVYVAGMETQLLPPDNAQVVGLLKYDVAGKQLWEDNVGPPFYGPGVVGFALDGSRNVYLEFNILTGAGAGTGYQTCKVSSSGTTVWYDYNPTGNGNSLASGLVLDSKTNITVTGRDSGPPVQTYGTYKLDPNGNYIWTNLYSLGSYGGSSALALAVDSANNIYVTGESSITNAPYDIATLKLDPNGKQLWVQRYDGPGHGNDAANAIAVDNSGNVYVAGYETETNGFTSMILIKYSPVALQKQSNGSVILHAYGSPGETFDIQASTNLQTWQDLGSVIADTNGILSFDDTNASLFPNRFYYTVPQ